MPVFLEVRSGAHTGAKIRLNPGQPVRVGRTNKADFVLSDDPNISSLHFSVESAENGCRLTDLNSRNGSWLNGQRITTAVLGNGDTITAGQTRFVVSVETTDAAMASGVAAPLTLGAGNENERLLKLLRESFQPLYAILDSARDIRILALMLHYKEPCQSLYEGPQGATLAQVAPYLVRLTRESALLEALVKEGWGKNWGVYLTCASSFDDLRRHLRHFLQVKLPSGEQVYFRFYDPRVLRVYLPTCVADEANQFFGPIQGYFMEDEKPEQLLRFVNTGRGAQSTAIQLQESDEQRKKTQAHAPETARFLESPLPGEVK